MSQIECIDIYVASISKFWCSLFAQKIYTLIIKNTIKPETNNNIEVETITSWLLYIMHDKYNESIEK